GSPQPATGRALAQTDAGVLRAERGAAVGLALLDPRARHAARIASILSQIIAAMSGPPSRWIARMPVGDVTLISVSQLSITSMPVNRRPRSRSAGPRRGAVCRPPGGGS